MKQVSMYRLTDSVNSTVPEATWEVELPNGKILNTIDSLTCGLQEAIDYAAAFGWPLKVYGGQVKHSNFQNPAIIMCRNLIMFPPLELGHIEIDATLNFCGPNPRFCAVLFDSMMASTVRISGQIVCANGWPVGVRFKPEMELPCDQNGPVITASTIHLPSVVMVGAGVAIDFDASLGAITGNTFQILEPNGGTVGIKVEAGGNTCFDHNHLVIRECHGQTSGIVAGTLANAARVFGNSWFATLMPKSVGVEVFGHHNYFNLSIDDREGTPACGITLNPGAAHNILDVLMNDATLKINDASGVLTNAVRMP